MRRVSRGYTCRKFRRNFGGYTIIEVTIFLAVSGVILSAAILMFRGQQGKTEFTQSMRDIDSKVQSVAKDIASGVSAAPDKPCVIDAASGRPSLSSAGTSSGVGTNAACIFLGKAIQVDRNSDTFTIYTVLGKRDVNNSFISANPTPVSSETYPLIGGSTVIDSTMYDLAGTSHRDAGLVGIYLGMNSDDTDRASAGGSLFMRGYALSNSGACVQQQNSACNVMNQVGKWEICLQSAYNSSTAKLDIIPSSSGITTQLSFDGCS